MIGIRNISKVVRSSGLHTYEVSVTVIAADKSVSLRKICTFRHRREDGLSVCLSKAADAVKRSKNDELMAMMSFFDEKDLKSV